MIMDPSDISWEIQNCCGTLYVATSRGKTLGSKENIECSNLRRDNIVKKTTKINILSTVLQRGLRLGLVWGGGVSACGGSMIGYYYFVR